MAVTMGNPDWHMLVPWAKVTVTPSATLTMAYTGPCIYHGGCIEALGALGISIKDDNGTTNNGKVDVFDASVPVGTLHTLTGGVQCQYGISVSAGLTRAQIIIYYRPISSLFPFPFQ
jgi:hypothetical protein